MSDVTGDAAGRVLTNATLVKMITGFQGGLLKALYDFARLRFPDWNAVSASQRRQRVRLLGIEVIRRGDLSLLQLASHVQFYEPVGRQLVAHRIPLPIQHAIENERPEMLRWIFAHGSDPYARATDMWNDAIATFHGDFSMLNELKTLLLASSDSANERVEIRVSSVYRLLDINLLRWIHEKVPGAHIPAARVMSEAADAGKLEVVRFLHEIYPEVIYRSDMYHRALASGATAVLEFLLKHRSEPYSDRFLERVLGSGNLRVLEMVHRYRGLRIDPRLLDLARNHSDSAVQKFLLERASANTKTDTLGSLP